MPESTLRFTDQDDRTISLLARVQRETGYVPTMDELGQLLECPTTAAARARQDALVAAGEGAYLTPEKQQELNEIAAQAPERFIHGFRQPMMIVLPPFDIGDIRR